MPVCEPRWHFAQPSTPTPQPNVAHGEFLRACAFPCNLLPLQRNPAATFTKEISALPPMAQKVIYWANDAPPTPQGRLGCDSTHQALARQSNTGVAPVVDGRATLYLECPARAQTRPLYLSKGSLSDGVHKVAYYRSCEGMHMGPIYTVDLSRECGYD